MATPTTHQCECGNDTSFDHKKSFLGFTKLVCTVCKKQHDDQSAPLSKGYRITYWIIGVWFGLALLDKTPIFIAAAKEGLYVLFIILMEQSFLILFVVGSIGALKKDALIQKQNRREKESG